uniref:Uncharacterized protein n=1 Tax=Ditylenchus dipsaci TaxID=166011 RepID=A0A915CTD8_9BILA
MVEIDWEIIATDSTENVWTDYAVIQFSPMPKELRKRTDFICLDPRVTAQQGVVVGFGRTSVHQPSPTRRMREATLEIKYKPIMDQPGLIEMLTNKKEQQASNGESPLVIVVDLYWLVLACGLSLC